MTCIPSLVSSLLLCAWLLSASPARSDPQASLMPHFEKQVVREHLDDAYWIEAFQPDSDTPVGLIGYGLVDGTIHFYPNPSNRTPGDIESLPLHKFVTPVGMDQADLSGDGFNDLIVCFDYGNTIKDFNADGGHIVWLENPGHDFRRQVWKRHYVGRSPAMHRLKVGHFTQNQRWEIVGLPIVNGPVDVPVPVLLFQEPANLSTAAGWHRQVIDDEHFHLVHDATKFRVGTLDQLLIASQEGLTWLHYHEPEGRWISENIATGEQGEKRQTNYFGSGGVSIGRVGDDTFAYIAALEPFHGNVLAVYTKSASNRSLTGLRWERHVLDVFGAPDQNGEGPSHHVICADFDRDGDEEFVVTLRGPAPHQGVFYYKLIDRRPVRFAKWKVSEDSAARIAVADYDHDGQLDFATIGYSVPGYFMAEKAAINVFYNRFHDEREQLVSPFQVRKQHDELLFTLPRAQQARQYSRLPFLSVAGIDLSLEVIPPFSSRHLDRNTHLKVLEGRILWTDSSNRSRTFLCEPKRVCSLALHSDNGRVRTEEEGALLFVLQHSDRSENTSPFDRIETILLANLLPEDSPADVRDHSFRFIRADQLEWGKTPFRGVEFYNLRGFDLRFADNGEQLCHVQLWAAATGTNAGVHNHLTDRFCEVHLTLLSGNQGSGMQYIDDPLRTAESEFVRLALPEFHEHGPLWKIDSHGRPVRRDDGSVVYPWHKWQSGSEPLRPATSNQSFDVWIAFEFNPSLSTFSQ